MALNLPIDAVLPDVVAALRQHKAAVIVAPPGAGKTTRIAPALLSEPWCSGEIWLLSPRRLSARAAAERIAEELGGKAGGIVGYATRLDSKHSAETRLMVMTPGLSRSRILADPELNGVSAVLFDEVHERSLDSDFSLALALDCQQGLRDDLRLVAMSATLDGARFSAILGDAPVIESLGRSWPLEHRYLGRKPEERLEAAMLSAVRTALAEQASGDILAFLPGVAEIERTADAAENAKLPLAIHKLHGQVDPPLQRLALAPDADGRRKLILATSIAETSLTIEGVRIVIDCGLARRPRFDKAAGLSRLVTERASQAAATQRAGRAARQGAGVAYRLWEAAATAGMPPFDPPEILESDLMPLVLDCAAWGVTDPRTLSWLDEPAAAGLEEARSRLLTLGALDKSGHITAAGRAMASLPMPVPLAHMMLEAAAAGEGRKAADIAVMLTENGLGGRMADLEQRIARARTMRGQRAEGAARLAQRLAKLAETKALKSDGEPRSLGAWIATAWPDRLARARAGQRGEFLSAGGRAYKIDPLDPLAGAEWIAVGEAQGQASGTRILAAAMVDDDEVETLFADRIEDRVTSQYDAALDRVEQKRERRLGAIVLKRGQEGGKSAAAESIAVRMAAVKAKGLSLIAWGRSAEALRKRAAFAGVEALSDEALLDSMDYWLEPALAHAKGLRDLDDRRLTDSMLNFLDWSQRQALDSLAPSDYKSPAGNRHAIDYVGEGGPIVTLRVQELFGLARHPTVGRPAIPLILALTSPAHRPIQTTRDLPSFWAGSWVEVAKEMRGRYPRHNWPDDPTDAKASLLTKAAQARREGKKS
jgi:ATP-dependent helicase HrpB